MLAGSPQSRPDGVPRYAKERRGLVDGIAGVVQDDDRALGRAQTLEREADG